MGTREKPGQAHGTSSGSCKDYCMVPPRSVPEVSCIGLQWFLLGQLHRKTCDGNDNGDERSPNSLKFRLWLQTLWRFRCVSPSGVGAPQ